MGRDLVHDFICPDYRVQVKEVLDTALKVWWCRLTLSNPI